jgi:hypothetical protein
MNKPLKQFIRGVTSAFDAEVARISISNPDYANQIGHAMMSRYLGENIHSFFVLSNLKDMTETIQRSPMLRDAIFNIADRASAHMAIIECDIETIHAYIVESVCRNRVDVTADNQSLISPDTNDALYIRPEILKILLASNYWLVCVWVLMMYFQHSTYFKSQEF